jgi:flagellar biosynthesis/type III secretory pathway protein FliH
MRKWSPDPFGDARKPNAPRFEPWPGIRPSGAASAAFLAAEADPPAAEVPGPSPEEERMDALNARLRALEEDHARRLEEVRQDFRSSLRAWQEAQDERREHDARRLAEAATGLAVAMAEKIVRARVAADRGVLLRTLETALFKIQATGTVTVFVHPDDAVWLATDADTRRKLRLESVVPDRRIAPGGCRIACGHEEWDATLASQLADLGRLVEDALRDAESDAEDSGDEA